MAGENTVTTLNGLFKEAYADRLEDLIPDGVQLKKDVPFVASDKELGKQYNQPVILAAEHGFTYAGASAGAFSLNNAVAATLKNAALDATQLLLRTSIDYESAAKASNNKKSFKKYTGLLVMNMINSFAKRCELLSWYGQTGLGKIASSANSSATVTVLTMQTASYAAGIWAGSEGASLDAYNSTTLINTNAALVITAVDTEARTI